VLEYLVKFELGRWETQQTKLDWHPVKSWCVLWSSSLW
jgi:hypothetical protein